jgi:hypothetical protein
MKRFFLPALLFALPLCAAGQSGLKTPAEFLGYSLGERFTAHHKTVEYFEHVAEVMPNAEVFFYGETYEHRPLMYLVLTAPENFPNLEQIRKDNLARAGVLEGQPSADKKAIVWLSYNVHGNESSSMEASMSTLYDLINPENEQTQQWLKNTIVIMDPCINPDGRDRYANFYRQYGNLPANAAYHAAEHHEPWPGGRTNHYLFDLNRDWAWMTQIESQQRIKVYNEWLPHVHVDFHEQGYNNPYYFAPAAEPLHEVISNWQREFQVTIGKNNAKYFDEQGWLYFTKEVFDLYYPSYGDTYPTYSGAIGMTYEQAGGGVGGLVITTETGDPLSLKDRIAHHHTSGLSTVEVTSKNAEAVVKEFEKYFADNNNRPAAHYKTFVIKGGNNGDKLQRLTSWMQLHGIRFGHPASGKPTRGFNYQTQTVSQVNISSNDIIVNIFQPKSRFITTVFEPVSKLSDSVTYDITAWNLLYAYDLEAFALTEKISVVRPYKMDPPDYSAVSSKPYSYIFRYQSIEDVSFMAALMQNNIKVRSAEKSFVINKETFAPGSIVVTRRNNETIADFDSLVIHLAKKFNRPIHAASTGFVEEGKDFGSRGLNYLKRPEIALLSGEQTFPGSTGELWHFFEQQIRFPITLINSQHLKRVDLGKYDVLIIPDGHYSLFEERLLEKVASWVEGGGRLILISNALQSFVDKKGFGLKKYANDEEKEQAERQKKEAYEKGGFPRYEEVERKHVSQNISGAIYKIDLDNSHPLAFGMSNSYYTLKTNELRFAVLPQGWNVGYFKQHVKPVQGFAGHEVNKTLSRSLLFGVEEKGSGEVIYLVDNPLFRSFWQNGKMLFANAVFMVGQ